MQKNIKKLTYLDGIRGVASFMVVIHHFLLAFYCAYFNFDVHVAHLNRWDIKFGQSLFSVFANGNFCVCVFFVLSGYVLSRKYFKEHSTESLISGAQRRFVRLYLPLAATIIISAVMLKLHLYYNKPASVIAHSEWWFAPQWDFVNVWKQFYQCMLYRTMFSIDGTFGTSMWTISIEFYGSLFVFAFLALTHATRNRKTMIILSVLYCYYTDNAFLSAFLFGITLNYMELVADRLSSKLTIIIPLLLLISGLVLGSYPSNDIIANTFFSRTPQFLINNFNSNWVHVLGAHILILSFVLSPRLQSLISLRLFRFLGYISFSLYLLHPLVLGSVTSYCFLYLYPRYGYNHSTLLVFLITIIVCLPASWLMAKYIDGPGIKLSKYLYNKYVKNTLSNTESPV